MKFANGPGGNPDSAGRDPGSHRPRPPRFPIAAPLQYRKSGEEAWHQGLTENISRSGVLFRAEENLAPDTVLEMRIVFPAELTGGAPTRVVCWGPVVRQASPSPADNRPILAAAIVRYQYTHVANNG
jgi:hypothetical protein